MGGTASVNGSTAPRRSGCLSPSTRDLGMTSGKLKVLDELLAVVKDPQVARDAKKFRDELKKR